MGACVRERATLCASMRNASAYQREPECVAIANGLAGLDGPVINCVTHDYITDAADLLYYIRSYVRVPGGLRVIRAVRIRACLPDARGNALVRACNKSAATGERAGGNVRSGPLICDISQGVQMTHTKKRFRHNTLYHPSVASDIASSSYLSREHRVSSIFRAV